MQITILKIDNINFYGIILNKCGCGGIGSFELDRVLWTIKGKRKGVAVKIFVSLQDIKKFWVPQESHVNYIFYQFADVVELADTQDLGSCTVRCAGSSPVIRTKVR